jgi:hypothetical protein
MIRGPSSDDICAYCDYFTTKDADLAHVAAGMALCLKRVYTPMYDLQYVPWNNGTCVSFRLDRPNLAKRRHFVQQQKSKEANAQQEKNGINN